MRNCVCGTQRQERSFGNVWYLNPLLQLMLEHIPFFPHLSLVLSTSNLPLPPFVSPAHQFPKLCLLDSNLLKIVTICSPPSLQLYLVSPHHMTALRLPFSQVLWATLNGPGLSHQKSVWLVSASSTLMTGLPAG